MHALGCHVAAVDLRHGGVGEQWDRIEKRRFGTPNETWRSAREHLGQPLPSRESSYVDMCAAVEWVRELFPGAPIGLVGSSFSATMVLVYIFPGIALWLPDYLYTPR